jgi:dihydroorotate dehydrogenase (fumarate)
MTDALLESAKAEPAHLPCPVTFITATNTLGSSLLLKPTTESTSASTELHKVFHHVLNSANGTGIGGLAGAPLHPLALGMLARITPLVSLLNSAKETFTQSKACYFNTTSSVTSR